tara:strand:- start:466 stop:696 length:231 start_codon:yes stop_codon:yes gene_type:complete
MSKKTNSIRTIQIGDMKKKFGIKNLDKNDVPKVDLDELNELLKEPTEKAREIFKNNFKKGGLVIKGKPKLAKKGWR